MWGDESVLLKRYIRSTLSQTHLFNPATSSSSSASRDSAWRDQQWEVISVNEHEQNEHGHFTCKCVFDLEGILLCSVWKPKLVQQFSEDFSTSGGRGAPNSPVWSIPVVCMQCKITLCTAICTYVSLFSSLDYAFTMYAHTLGILGLQISQCQWFSDLAEKKKQVNIATQWKMYIMKTPCAK